MMYLVNKIMGVSQKVFLSLVGLSLVACTSTSQSTFMSYEELQNKVRNHEARWEGVQPTLERIDALEAELAELKQAGVKDDSMAMKSESMVKSAPILEETAPVVETSAMVAPMVIVDTIEVEKTKPIKREVKMANVDRPMMKEKSPEPQVQEIKPKTKSTNSGYGAQIAAYTNKDEAIRGWHVLQELEPDSFTGLSPKISEKQVNGRHMYQLKVGPFYGRSFGSEFCTMMSRKGYGCFVTQYNGESIPSH